MALQVPNLKRKAKIFQCPVNLMQTTMITFRNCLPVLTEHNNKVKQQLTAKAWESN